MKKTIITYIAVCTAIFSCTKLDVKPLKELNPVALRPSKDAATSTVFPIPPPVITEPEPGSNLVSSSAVSSFPFASSQVYYQYGDNSKWNLSTATKQIYNTNVGTTSFIINGFDGINDLLMLYNGTSQIRYLITKTRIKGLDIINKYVVKYSTGEFVMSLLVNETLHQYKDVSYFSDVVYTGPPLTPTTQSVKAFKTCYNKVKLRCTSNFWCDMAYSADGFIFVAAWVASCFSQF